MEIIPPPQESRFLGPVATSPRGQYMLIDDVRFGPLFECEEKDGVWIPGKPSDEVPMEFWPGFTSEFISNLEKGSMTDV